MLRTLTLGAAALALTGGALGADIRALGPFRAGDSVYDLVYRVKVEQTRGDEPPTTLELEQRARVRLAPVDGALAAQAERGAVVEMECSVESFRESWREGETDAEVVRPKITLEEEPDTPEMNALVALAAAVGAADIRVFVIAGTGVGRIDGLEGVEDSPIGAIGPEAIGLFAPEEFARAVATIFSAAGAARTSDPATSWTKEDALDLGAVGAVRIATRWAPAPGDADADHASFVGEMTATLVTADSDEAGAAVSGVITEQRGESAMRWDTALDRLASFRRSWTVASDWRLGPLTLRQTHEAALTVTRATE